MKTFFLIISLLLVNSIIKAYATGFSASTNGLYLVVEAWRNGNTQITNEPFKWSDELCFMAFCTTNYSELNGLNQVELQYSADPAYCVKLSMIGPNGNRVSKKGLGKEFGLKYDTFFDYADHHPGSLFASGTYEESQGRGMAKILPSPRDLFVMKDSGVYIMEIQIQMFHINQKPHWSRELIQFSPIKIRVEKPASRN